MLGLVLLLPPAARAAEACAPWPGEPAPLPGAKSPDPLLAGWARARARELGALAKSLESVRPLDARRLWGHVLCLAPGDSAAQEGLVRTTPVRVVRPAVVSGLRPAADVAPAAAPLAEQVEAPIVVSTPVPRPAGGAPDLAALDADLRYAERLLRAARFEDGLRAAERVTQAASAAGEGTAARTRLARASVLRATAELALGRDAAAQQSLGRALEAEPTLSLDPATTSPKVLRALEAARAARGGGP